MAHAILGITLFVLFAAHHLLNMRWFRMLGRGRYNTQRTLFVAIDALLCAAMVLMAVSSVLMSGSVFEAAPIRTTQFARDLHLASSAWGFLLMAIHLGLHTRGALSRMRAHARNTAFDYVQLLLMALIALAGVWCFADSGLLGDMLLLGTRRNHAAGVAVSFARYLCVVASVCIAVYGLFSISRMATSRRSGKQ
ncbi:hypothetical protein G1C95_0380 [Bifidobacterium sp. DSM 109957]|uniref:Flavinylation-associated cytochrome domain-containing protein n=2 Tax=Bifidobacterium oedipodis TaxID=2675322 RepID=A0A7Y0HQR5_9BIFI|nr:hypothetical protein [Bifidobacterium sp. DSM 109957]